MANKINFVTGETYTLSELFSGTHRIIIPDLQRDYCWGNKSETKGVGSLVEGFIETLIEQFESHPYGRLSLGLLYGYESPADYVQLCDGQQRITTLFLLLGMLNRWAGDDRYRHYLMSDFEFYEDDHEPYLQYSIRESSLYFMSDLVYQFFTHGSNEHLESVNTIYDFSTGESCAWFYGEYATDPSIISMLRCLESIEKSKERILPEGDPNRLEAFVEFIVNRLTFIYYDMETRANGEETFVVINTTGEPLSATENLKPLIINNEINKSQEEKLFEVNGKCLPMANAWEEMENYFWKIRRQKDYDTADSGFKEFLRWVTLLYLYNSDTYLFKQNAKEDFDFIFPYKEIPITEIIRLFNVFIRLRNDYSYFFDTTVIPGQGDKLDQKQLFVLLPLLAYLVNHPNEDGKQFTRLWKWLVNIIRVNNVSKAVNDLLQDVIHIGATITDPVEILNISGISTTILSEEEQIKLEILSKCTSDEERCNLEEDIWSAQDMEVDLKGALLFSGEIRAMLMWSTPNCTFDASKFNPARFKYYLTALRRLLRVGPHHTINDNTRRALLAWGYKGFPWGRSYGWTNTWKDIIYYNIAEFRRFVETAESIGLDHIIRLDGTGNPIVRYSGILGYSDKKNFDTWKESGYNVCLSSYAKPIPVSLATIMAQMGADVVRNNYRQCGDWWLIVTNDGELVITPVKPELKRVAEIRITSVAGGEKLHYHVKASTYEFKIILPNASIDILISKLIPEIKRKSAPLSQMRRRKAVKCRKYVGRRKHKYYVF